MALIPWIVINLLDCTIQPLMNNWRKINSLKSMLAILSRVRKPQQPSYYTLWLVASGQMLVFPKYFQLYAIVLHFEIFPTHGCFDSFVLFKCVHIGEKSFREV